MKPISPTEQRPERVWQISRRNFYVARRSSAIDKTRYFVAEYRILFAFLRPQHFLDRVVEGVHASLHRSLPPEFSHRVIEQKRRGGPQTDQRRDAGITTSAGGHLVFQRTPVDGVLHRDFSHRRQILIGLRRKIIPDISPHGVGRQRATRVGLQQRQRDATIRRKIIVGEKVVGHDYSRHLGFEIVSLGPSPILLPIRFIDVGWCLGNFARMAARTKLSEHYLAPAQFGLVRGQILSASRRVLEEIGFRYLKKKQCDIRRLSHGRIPITRILFAVLDPDRQNPCTAKQRIEMQQPLFAKKSNTDKHPVQRAEKADRVGSVFESVCRPYQVWRLKKFRQTRGLRKVVELLVVEISTRELLTIPPQSRR